MTRCASNRLLAALPEADRSRLMPHLVPVELLLRQRLASLNRPIEHVVFVESGLVSVVGGIRGDLPVEVGVIGREGVANLAALLGSDRSPVDCMVQIGGAGLAIDARLARSMMDRSAAMNDLVRRYACAFMAQMVSSVVAAARGSVSQRLARWLLMAHDRVGDDGIPLTHEFLSYMLAVRRPSVTLTLSEFESSGWIERHRGMILLRDRKALLELADGFYGMAEREIERVLSLETRG